MGYKKLYHWWRRLRDNYWKLYDRSPKDEKRYNLRVDSCIFFTWFDFVLTKKIMIDKNVEKSDYLIRSALGFLARNLHGFSYATVVNTWLIKIAEVAMSSYCLKRLRLIDSVFLEVTFTYREYYYRFWKYYAV